MSLCNCELGVSSIYHHQDKEDLWCNLRLGIWRCHSKCREDSSESEGFISDKDHVREKCCVVCISMKSLEIRGYGIMTVDSRRDRLYISYLRSTKVAGTAV